MIKINIEEYKNYQLQACYNRMHETRQNCGDNLTDYVTRCVISLIGEEANKRGLEFKDNNGYYDLNVKQ